MICRATLSAPILHNRLTLDVQRNSPPFLFSATQRMPRCRMHLSWWTGSREVVSAKLPSKWSSDASSTPSWAHQADNSLDFP